jgi:hypothetical protein
VRRLDLTDTLTRPSRTIELPIHEVVLHPDGAHDLPPIELAQNGDRQVLLVEHAGVTGNAIDRFLERAPSVTTLLSNRYFTVERPQPRIEAVCCNQRIEEASIRNLPGLRAVRFKQRGRISLEWLDRSLEHLGGIDVLFEDFPSVTRFAHLQTLWLGLYADVEALSVLPSLAGLRHLYLGGPDAWSAMPIPAAVLEPLVNVEEAELSYLDANSLKALRRWSRLRRLHLLKRSETRGIEALQSLEEVVLEGASCPRIGPLTALPRLRHLAIRCGRGPADLEAVFQLRGLTSLTIDVEARGLETLDPGLFGALASLKQLALGGRYGGAEVARLREALPCCSIDVTVNDDVAEAAAETEAVYARGIVRYFPDRGDNGDEETRWTISQNLAFEMGVDSNHAVQKRVRAALRERAPAIAARIQFDSEADNFCAVGKDEADIVALADLIAELAG